MKEYEVKMVLDLNNPEGANFHNSIRSLDGIKNSISQFRDKLREMKGKENVAVEADKISIIEDIFVETFSNNGITV